MSLGGESPRCSRAYQEAIDEATNRGAVVVVAAGNDAVDARRATPANCRNVITVGATGPQGAPSYFSNWGPALTLSAPGGDERQGGAILSAVDSGQTTPRGATYGQMQGTSQATPHVAGVVALLKSLNRNMRFEDVRRALTESVQPVQNCSQGCGAGLLDAGAALEKAGNGSRGPAQPDPAAPDNPADPSRPNDPNAPADPIDSTPPTGAPTITMNNSTPRLHDRVAVAVSGFQPGENVHFVVDSRNFSLGSLTADSEGKVRGIWRVRYLLRGHHVLYAVGENSGKQASTPFEIIF
ncbi:S8 family serine peptidase [Corynebacterium falsenii]|uniref:S8 family serine peptidase n=1 Tax=Corynebacterium falsenii TaxID=108486 RepID=UPI0023F490F3|nr:S8 family serine peptidase [Corynebacterium falsenii]